jgi:hypothetical protein
MVYVSDNCCYTKNIILASFAASHAIAKVGKTKVRVLSTSKLYEVKYQMRNLQMGFGLV